MSSAEKPTPATYGLTVPAARLRGSLDAALSTPRAELDAALRVALGALDPAALALLTPAERLAQASAAVGLLSKVELMQERRARFALLLVDVGAVTLEPGAPGAPPRRSLKDVLT